MSTPVKKSGVASTLAGLFILGIAAVIIAAVALVKPRHVEDEPQCSRGLKAAYLAERVYFEEHDVYARDPSVMGFVPPPPQTAQYLFNVNDSPPVHGVPAIQGLGIEGQCPSCVVTIGCAVNIDDDDLLEEWSISTGDRTVGNEPASRGIPIQHFDDVSNVKRLQPSMPGVPK